MLIQADARFKDALDALRRVSEFLDDYSDVNDGDDGQPIANRAMLLKSDVDAIVERLEHEHAGGSLNGPSRLGASPNTDTGGECVLVPRSLVSATLNLLGATSLGLHGTPWAQSEIQALIRALDVAL